MLLFNLRVITFVATVALGCSQSGAPKVQVARKTGTIKTNPKDGLRLDSAWNIHDGLGDFFTASESEGPVANATASSGSVRLLSIRYHESNDAGTGLGIPL